MIDTTEGRAAWDREVATAHGWARGASAALIGMGFTHICITALSDPQITAMFVGSSTDRVGQLQLVSSARLFHQGLHLVTVVLFLLWLSKSVNVARQLGISPPLAFTASEACWGFFIPLINLVRPYQVIRDLHDRLAPDGVPEPAPKPRTDGVGGYRRIELEKAPPPAPLPHASIGAWWALYLFGGWLPAIVLLTFGGVAAKPGRLFQLAPPAMEVLSAVLAVLVVRAIDGRLAERHRRLHHATDEELTEWGVEPPRSSSTR